MYFFQQIPHQVQRSIWKPSRTSNLSQTPFFMGCQSTEILVFGGKQIKMNKRSVLLQELNLFDSLIYLQYTTEN